MRYVDTVKYRVEITLVDKSKDAYTYTGDQVSQLQQRIWITGYIRVDKSNPKISFFISPWLITEIKVTLITEIKVTEK